MMNPGIPDKRRKFEFLTEDGDLGDCYLDGDTLYTLCQKRSLCTAAPELIAQVPAAEMISAEGLR